MPKQNQWNISLGPISIILRTCPELIGKLAELLSRVSCRRTFLDCHHSDGSKAPCFKYKYICGQWFSFVFVSTLTWLMLKRCFLYPLFILLTTVELYISPRLCFAKPSCFHLIHQSCSSWMILPGLSCIYFRSSHLIWKFTTTHAVTLSGSFSYLAQGYSKFPVSAGNTSPVQLGWHVTACGCVFISLFPQVLAKQKLLA